MLKIGMVGCGVVGETMLKGYQCLGYDVVGYDKFKEQYKNNFEEVMKSDISFLCLPTIAAQNGQMDLSPFDETLDRMKDYKGLVVIKSTVLPGTTDKYQSQYPKLRMVHSPEFLTEKNAMIDFFSPHKIVLGIPEKYNVKYYSKTLDELCDMKSLFMVAHQKFKPEVSVTTARTSEFMKFMSNCFFATKVVFANEMNEIAELYGADYDVAKELLYMDPRVGKDHLSINNERKFGGLCLVKDSNQLLSDLYRQDIIPEVLAKVKEVNERNDKLKR